MTNTIRGIMQHATRGMPIGIHTVDLAHAATRIHTVDLAYSPKAARTYGIRHVHTVDFFLTSLMSR